MHVGKLYESVDWNEHPMFTDEDDYEKYYWQRKRADIFLNPKDVVMFLGADKFSAEYFARVLYKGRVLYILKRHLIPVAVNKKIG